PDALHKLKKNVDPDSALHKSSSSKFDGTLHFWKGNGILKLLPVEWIQQYNSDHPYGINDGAMIPAKGYQTLFSAGLFVRLGPLSIQLKPEAVYAENKPFKGFPDYQNYLSYLDNIDLPERFRDKPYQKLFWGQSSIRLTAGPVSFGLSNENLWWGPGTYNALLMTNNAPGFEHFTLNTVRPIKTPIGSFEGQLIAGRLEVSGDSATRNSDWRYLNWLELSYQPRWIPGLFLGVNRSFISYGKNLKSLNDYLPVITPVTKASDGGASEDAKGRDQIASLFMRWAWPEEHGEIYFEYGKEDHNWNMRDFLQEASHSAAYILGLRKLVPLKARKDEYIQINMEVTQLESNSATINRGWTARWYTHSDIHEGYTNLGQVLGAGIGPGSNLQTIQIGWVKGLKNLGIQLERFVHNNN
ncbi:MAG: capsule assembly Wzi family protein, partial [Bacteroidota bacterium]|nr:capsule assembly Wzi family protein [Bacteroidota bacterium]